MRPIKFHHPRHGLVALRERHAGEAVAGSGIERELGDPAGSEPARRHEQRIVEQQVARADQKSAGGMPARFAKSGDTSASWRSWMPCGTKKLQKAVTPAVFSTNFSEVHCRTLGDSVEVEAAIVQDRAAERRQLVPVAQAQQRHGGEMRAGQLAADGKLRCAEALDALTHHPECGGLAVVRPGRIGMLRREPVLHRDAGDVGAVRDALEQRIVQLRRAERPSAAMDMEEDAARRFRRDDAQVDRSGPAVDRDGLGAFGLGRSGKAPSPCSRRARTSWMVRPSGSALRRRMISALIAAVSAGMAAGSKTDGSTVMAMENSDRSGEGRSLTQQ